MATEQKEDETQEPSSKINPKFVDSDRYKDVIFYLQNISCSPAWDKDNDISIKLKAIKYCILGKNLFWKDPGGIFLNCLIEEETEGIVHEFHKGVCGGHHAWRVTAYKILKVGYYCPSLFSDVNCMIRSWVECQMFVGKQKLQPLPLKLVKA
jgi:hypothetical protein